MGTWCQGTMDQSPTSKPPGYSWGLWECWEHGAHLLGVPHRGRGSWCAHPPLPSLEEAAHNRVSSPGYLACSMVGREASGPEKASGTRAEGCWLEAGPRWTDMELVEQFSTQWGNQWHLLQFSGQVTFLGTEAPRG